MILIALGANLPTHAGAPAFTLRAALASLAKNGVIVRAVSTFYRTPAWPDPRDPAFVNAVARIETELSPVKLMELLQSTETAFGRARGARNAPRTLDLDVLDYNSRVEEGPPILPHPRIAGRAFVLIPLRDVAPEWCDPVSGKSIVQLMDELAADARAAVTPLN